MSAIAGAVIGVYVVAAAFGLGFMAVDVYCFIKYRRSVFYCPELFMPPPVPPLERREPPL